MKRFVELDLLRGGLLLMMIVDHSPSWLWHFTDQPLGFFSTAECFVFVSAFLAGMLFRKRTEKIGFGLAGSSPANAFWETLHWYPGRIASVKQKLPKTHSSQDRSLSFAEALVYSSWEARAWKNE